MNVSSDELVARFQKDWPKEFEISFRRIEGELLRRRVAELEEDRRELVSRVTTQEDGD